MLKRGGKWINEKVVCKLRLTENGDDVIVDGVAQGA